MSHKDINIDGGFEQTSAALRMMPPWTIEQLDRKAEKRPPGYKEAVLERAHRRDDGKYELREEDYDEITERFTIKRPTLASVVKLLTGKPTPHYGPGTELKQSIQSAFGLGDIKGCGCQAVIDQMNRWGVEGCREPANFNFVVDHLMKQKNKLAKLARKMTLTEQQKPTFMQNLKRNLAMAATAVTLESLQRAGLGLIVTQAIDRAETHDRRAKKQNAVADQE